MSHDGRLTVVRPSFDCRSKLLKLVSVLALLLTIGVGSVWGQSCTSMNGSTKDTQTTITSSNAASGSAGTKISWSGDGTCSSSQWRFAANKSVTFTATSGYQITSIVFTSTSSSDYYGTWSATAGSKSTSGGATTFSSINSSSVTLKTTTVARMKTCVVTYTAAPSGYSITYHCNGATSGCPSNASGQSTLPNPLPTPAKTGFTFGGWYTDAALTSAASAGATLSANADLYAKWTCNVTLNRNGATETINNIVEGTALDDIDGTGAQGGCSAWTFVGWSKTQRAAQNVSTPMTLVTEVDGAGPYYAVYSHTESGGTTTKNYSITFDDNGSDSSTDLTTSTFKGKVSGNADSISSVTSVTKCYAGAGGLKMSSQKQNGSFTLSLAHALPITKIVLNAKRGSTSGTYANGVTVGRTAFSTSSSYSTSFVDLEFTGTKTSSNSLTVTSTSSTAAGKTNANRVTWLSSITIYFEASGDVTYYSTTASCCTPLGSINGSINMTSSTDGTVTVKDWSEVSNASSYTVKLYQKNGESWDLVAGDAGTKTGITIRSTGATFSGLTYGATYKFTVTAIGTGSYCDGPETAVTSINSNALTNNKFLNKYYIHIDDGTNSDSGWEDYYFTSLTSHAGSVDVTLNAFTDYYQYKLSLGGVIWWGNNSKMTSSDHTNWTLYTAQGNVKLQTAMGGTYTFGLNAATPAVTVTYPTSNQASGYHIYFDNSILEWSTLRYRIGNNSHNQNSTLALVTGTDNFYVATTPSYDGMEAWHIANNTGWADSHTIYRTATNNESGQPEIAITASIVFQQYKVTEDITVIPTTSHTTGTDNTGDKVNNQCEFYTINTPTSGMLTHNVSVGTAAHGTLVATYTNTSGATGQTVAEGANADLAHRCIVTITATPDAGYQLSSLTVNGAAFTSGNEHILTADAAIAATFTAQTSTITLDNNDATSGSSQTVTATYDADMPLTTTSSTAVVALSRTGYTFTGWWDATSGGTQYYSYNAGTSTLSSARTWDKTGAQTLKAQWSINSYTLTWAWGGGSTSAASGEDYTAAGSVAYNTALVYPANNTMSRNGYTFTGWSSSATNMPAEALTITAQWEAKQYTVTLDNKSATTSGSTSVTATFDAILSTIIPPTKDGYRFDGYWTEASGGTKYINADGTGATAYKKYSAGEHKLHAHWVAQLTFSVNGAIDDELTRDDNTAMPSTAAVPTACGDCWAFMGWSTNSSESGAPAYAGGATHEFGEPTTLYAVFGKAEYQMITSTSELEANDYYVVASSTEWALSNADHSYYNTSNYYTHTDAASTDISSISKSNASGYYIYNPPASIIWKLTGTKDAGQLQNVATPAKYVNLTATNLLATAQDLKFSVSSDGESWIIQYSTTNFLHGYTDSKGNGFETLSSSNWEEGDYSAFLYRQISAEYATEPSCETYTITWMVNGVAYTTGSPTEETNTCTGIETLPTAPSNSTLDCADRFMGWSESTLTGTGKSAPADLFISAKDAPIINENKTFHAVFAKGEAGGSGSVVLSYTSLGLTTSYESGSTKTVSDIDFYCNDIMTGTSGQDGYQKIQFKKSSTGPGYLYNSEAMPGNITSIVFESTTRNMTVNFGTSSNPDGSAETKTCSSGSLTATPTGSYNYFKILNAADNAAYTGTITINYTDVTYNNYVTSCCDKNITIGTPSITGGGTVTFTLGGDAIAPGDEVETCSGAKNVVATVTPAAGYSCTALSFSGGSVSVDPTPGAGNYPSAPSAQNYTLSFGANTTSATLSTTATFTAKALEGWTWMYKKDADVADDSVDPYAIPDVVEIYKDQYARFIITGYAPADVIAEKQGYVYSAGGVEPAYTTDYLTRVANTATYFTLKGKNPVESTTITFKAVGDASITRTMTIRVKALPLVHFVDNVHNVAFDDVVATVTTGVVTLTKKTPTQDDFDGSTKNTCEETHLHLVGWIDGEWEPYQAYMDGTGEKPTASAIIGATGYFYAPNADIDLVAKDGHTYYAVWANVE